VTANLRANIVEAYDLVRARLEPGRMGGRVARSSVKTILVNGIGAAVSFAVQIALSNILGKDQFGSYLLAMAWLTAAQLCGLLELDVTSVRFVGSYVATERWNLLRGFMRSARTAVVGTSFALASLAAGGIMLFSDSIAQKHPQLPGTLLVSCAMLPVATLLLLESAMLQGLQRYVQAQLPTNLLRPVMFGILLIVGVFIAGVSLTTPLAIVGNLISALTALAITWWWRHRAVPAQAYAAPPAYDRGTWVRTTYPLVGVAFGQLVISQQADIIVVGVMLTTAEAAVYGAATQLTLPLMLALSSVTYVAQSMIADIYARDRYRLQSLVRAVTWLTTALGVPMAVGLIVLGRPLLNLYGEGFAEGHTILILLTFAQLVVGLVGSLAGYLMTMTAHEREAAWIIGLAAALNLVLALVLTPRFGPIGTASGTLIAAVARAAALSVYIRRAMGLRLLSF
jgi:O-antigen/teichoic acid export membrane protein